MKQTKQVMNQETLENLGWKQTETRSGKYVCMSHHLMVSKVFLGRAGAVRVGKNTSTSRSTNINTVVTATKHLEIQAV